MTPWMLKAVGIVRISRLALHMDINCGIRRCRPVPHSLDFGCFLSQVTKAEKVLLIELYFHANMIYESSYLGPRARSKIENSIIMPE